MRSPRLSSAFFTCADLQQSDLGEADVTASDFTGANLRGADLSKVTGLTSEQLGGALIGPETDLPQNVQAPPQPGWGIVQNGDAFSPVPCLPFLVDRMTDLLPGSGYSSRLPCGDDRSQWPVRLEPSSKPRCTAYASYALDLLCARVSNSLSLVIPGAQIVSRGSSSRTRRRQWRKCSSPRGAASVFKYRDLRWALFGWAPSIAAQPARSRKYSSYCDVCAQHVPGS